jgi:hypothetical protein
MACRLPRESRVDTSSSVDLTPTDGQSLRRELVIMPARAMFLACAFAALGGAALVIKLQRSRPWWLPLAPHAGFLLAHAAHGVALAKYSGAATTAYRTVRSTRKRARTSTLRTRRIEAGAPARPQPASAA